MFSVSSYFTPPSASGIQQSSPPALSRNVSAMTKASSFKVNPLLQWIGVSFLQRPDHLRAPVLNPHRVPAE